MRQLIKIFLAIIMFPFFVYSQGVSNRLYVYKSPHYYESIELLDNGSFIYYNKTELTKVEITGNWQIRNDSILVLDSSPQRSKIIIFESYKKNKGNIFNVRDMDGHEIYYNLYLITKENDTIEFKGQFGETIASGKFSSFYTVDTKGQYSPIYKIKGVRTNFFNIFLERKRVFDNEYWKYYGQYMVPLSLDGKYANYTLIKK